MRLSWAFLKGGVKADRKSLVQYWCPILEQEPKHMPFASLTIVVALNVALVSYRLGRN